MWSYKVSCNCGAGVSCAKWPFPFKVGSSNTASEGFRSDLLAVPVDISSLMEGMFSNGMELTFIT